MAQSPVGVGPKSLLIPPSYRAPSRPLWALEALKTIQGRDSAGQKEYDIFRLRLTALRVHELAPTIIQILGQLSGDSDIGLLAKSMLIELGSKQDEQLIIPEQLQRRNIYYAARLLILSQRVYEAKSMLNRMGPAVKAKTEQILIRDPNIQVRQTVCAW